MLKDSKRVFELYVNEKGFSTNRTFVLNGVYKKIEKWESKTNKNLKDMSKEEIIKLCVESDEIDKNITEKDSLGRKRKQLSSSIANRSYGGMQTKMEAINDILEWVGSEVRISMKDFDTKKILKDEEHRYFTKEEIQDVCDLFVNPQDKFIIYGIFSGIYGKAYSDLLNLTSDDIDMENRIIKTLSGKVIAMDEYLFDIVKDATDPVWGGFYYKYFAKGEEGTSTQGYALNTDSKYIIKSKPYSKNNNGLDAMKTNGIQTRLKKLSEVSEVNLSGIDILRSGVMHLMHQLETNKGMVWTCASVEKWLGENGISAQPFELYRLYKKKYQETQEGNL